MRMQCIARSCARACFNNEPSPLHKNHQLLSHQTVWLPPNIPIKLLISTSSNMSSDWSLLPLAPLKLILQRLPLNQRMRSCALVSSSWAVAAIAATADLTISQLHLDSSKRAKACHSWCLQHHAYVKDVSYRKMRVMGSPMDHRHLWALSICNTTWTVRLVAHGEWRGLLQDATALTSLRLENTSVYGWPEAAAQLTSLKSLVISNVTSNDPDNPHIPGSQLSLLQQLTYLQFQAGGEDTYAHTAAALQQLSHLSRLQELRLERAVWVEDAYDSEEEEAEEGAQDAVLLSDVTCNIAHLQCLTSLTMFSCSSSLTALQELTIDWCDWVEPDCQWLAGGIMNLMKLAFTNNTLTTGIGQRQLLQSLGNMMHLTFLDLTGSLGTHPDNWKGVPLSALTSITAGSSSLQHLSLAECSMPQGAWRSIFHQDGQLTALTHLSLQDVAWHRFQQEAGAQVATSDVKRLVQACPNLRYLNLRDALQAKASLLPLTKLSALTELDVDGVTTESAVRVLAQLSGLRFLRVRQPSEVSQVSRLHLTTLKQLRELVLPSCRSTPVPFGDQFADLEEDEEGFRNKGPEVPDVWAQLLLDCHNHMRLPAAQQAEARQAAHKFKLRLT